MKTHWKASGISNLTDARYFNAMEDCWISFAFDVLHPQTISIEKAKAVLEWLHEPLLVASFGLHQDSQEISFVLESTGIKYVELPIEHVLCNDEELLPNLFISLDAKNIALLKAFQNLPKGVIVDVENFSAADNGLVEDLKSISKSTLLFIKTAAQVETLKSWLTQIPDAGIELNTLPEERPGWSAVDVYDTIIEELDN